MAVCKLTFTRVAVGITLAILGYYCFSLYHMFHPPQCSQSAPQNCITPVYRRSTKLGLWIFKSTKKTVSGLKKSDVLLHVPALKDFVKKEMNVTIPVSTRKNGSLYAHVFLGPEGKSPLHSSDRQHMSLVTVPLTKYAIPEAQTFNLFTGSAKNSTGADTPVTHWIPWLHVYSVEEEWRFDLRKIPAEIWRTLQLFQRTAQYLPILYVDRLRVTRRHLKPLSTDPMALEVSYSPVSVGQLRLWLSFGESMKSMTALGFSEKQLDDIKGVFFDTNLWLFLVTMFVTFFHLLFDILAFKSDISFWRGRKTMVGLSTKALEWTCISQLIIFFYLLDEGTSLLVLIPAGIASIIEFWKLGKAFKIRIKWSGLIPTFERGQQLEVEKATESFDSEAMHYLSYVLYPLVIGGAMYQLVYSSYKSWYSWMIHSLVNGVYAFGFLFMLPQLFLNYKLKSVAHLPWRAFMYKAFNTFIDDLFAFIIVVPTSHRVAVFRDDLVFLVYLYQRWLYPVDKSRVNEFGESFEDQKLHKD